LHHILICHINKLKTIEYFKRNLKIKLIMKNIWLKCLKIIIILMTIILKTIMMINNNKIIIIIFKKEI